MFNVGDRVYFTDTGKVYFVATTRRYPKNTILTVTSISPDGQCLRMDGETSGYMKHCFKRASGTRIDKITGRRTHYA